MAISQQQIGQRISELRKLRGFSQKELASNVKISRSALTQIELGNRSIDVFELEKLSLILKFSLDDIMSQNFPAQKEVESKEGLRAEKSEERIATPTLQLRKFKNVLLYILENCAGKPNVGETVLYKLLYFADFNYYELYEEHLTGATYRKLPYGPVPHNLDEIINQMIDTNQLLRIKTEYYSYTQTRYLPLENADLTALLASEKDVIDSVIDQMSGWSASDISNYSHKDMPWLASKEGEVINYELALYRDLPYSVRSYPNENEEQ